MRLSISNIAWDPAEDDIVAALLQEAGVDAIDIAPGKVFPDPAAAAPAQMDRVREAWAARGVAIVGMQALLFGTRGLNLFGDAASRAAMLERLAAVCRVGGVLGATRLVFGSPKNRDRGGLDDAAARPLALDFFRRLGDVAAAQGVVVCLEPNPSRYGCNFMTTTEEAADIVRGCAHPAIRLQFDTGTAAINGEDPLALLARHADIVGHVHASEPDLVTLGDGGTDHAHMAAALRAHLPQHLVTIEMVASSGEPHANAVARALRLAIARYGEPAAAAPLPRAA